MSQNQAAKPSIKEVVFRQANRVYWAASRVRYTLLHSQAIDYDDTVKINEMTDSLHEASVEIDHAIELLRELEQ